LHSAKSLLLRAIAAAKKKNDRIDTGKIADCLRCDFLPEYHMASTAIRDRRRTLRYRHLLVRQMVQMKNRISGLLMETGVSHNKQRLHRVSYFRELLSTNEDVYESNNCTSFLHFSPHGRHSSVLPHELKKNINHGNSPCP